MLGALNSGPHVLRAVSPFVSQAVFPVLVFRRPQKPSDFRRVSHVFGTDDGKANKTNADGKHFPPLPEVSVKTSGLKTKTHRDYDQRDQLQFSPGGCFYEHAGWQLVSSS